MYAATPGSDPENRRTACGQARDDSGPGATARHAADARRSRFAHQPWISSRCDSSVSLNSGVGAPTSSSTSSDRPTVRATSAGANETWSGLGIDSASGGGGGGGADGGRSAP